jgi:bifunctional non-homologous end joining protein LigD
MQFIVPAQPKLRSSPPVGDAWLHEAKFDGWRIQLHKHGSLVRLYTPPPSGWGSKVWSRNAVMPLTNPEPSVAG